MGHDNLARSEAPPTEAVDTQPISSSDLQGRLHVTIEQPAAGADKLRDRQAVVIAPPGVMQYTPDEVTSGLTGAAGATLVAKAAPGVFLAAFASNANTVSARYLLLFNKTAAPGAGNVPEIPGVPMPPLGAAEIDVIQRGLWKNTGIVLAVSTTQNSYTAVSADEHIITAWIAR